MIKIIEGFIARQLGHPSGFFSGFIAAFMNRQTAGINDMTIKLLEIRPTDRTLDIGFGGGSAITKVAKLAPDGLVAGIDISKAMLNRGRNKFRELISRGKVELKEGSAAKIPYENDWFDKVYTVNTIYFWPDPAAGLKEILRVMKKGATFVLTLFTEEAVERIHGSRYGFTIYSEDQLRTLLAEAGFINVQVEHREHKRFPASFLVANKR